MKRNLILLICLLAVLLLALAGKLVFDQATSWPARILDTVSNQALTDAKKVRAAFVDLFQLQPKIRVNENVVFDQTKTALELALVSRDTDVTRDAAQTWMGSTKTIRIHATYRVRAGFDLSQRLDVSVASKQVTIKVPKAKVLSVEPLSVAVEELRDGLWNKIQPQDIDNELKTMQVLARAKTTSLPGEAEQEFKRLLFQKLADLDLRVETQPNDVGK